MPTTAGGLPYPALSDSPNGPAAIQSLAEAIDSKVHRTVVDAAARTALVGITAGTIVTESNTGRVYLKTASGWNYVGGGTANTDIAYTALPDAFGWVSRSAGFQVRNGFCALDINHTRASWGANANLNQLPVGARPARTKYFLANWAGNVEAEIHINTDGFIVATDGGNNGLVGNIVFPVA